MATEAPVPATVDTEAIVQRIDGIVQELNELRKLLQAQPAPTTNNSEDVVQRLYGSLAPPTPDLQDDYNDYPDMDWKRFGE
jgi:hypothetical protein